MAIISCAECKHQISDKAANCPQCGAPQKQKPKVKIGGVLSLVVIAAVVYGFVKGGSEPATPTAPGIDSRTGRPLLDFGKPLFVMLGTPLCTSAAEVDAYRQSIPNNCTPAPRRLPVAHMETTGFLLPAYRIRVTDVQSVLEAWVPMQGVTN